MGNSLHRCLLSRSSRVFLLFPIRSNPETPWSWSHSLQREPYLDKEHRQLRGKVAQSASWLLPSRVESRPNPRVQGAWGLSQRQAGIHSGSHYVSPKILQYFSSSPSWVLLTICYTLAQALPKRYHSPLQKPHQEGLQRKLRAGKVICPGLHSY